MKNKLLFIFIIIFIAAWSATVVYFFEKKQSTGLPISKKIKVVTTLFPTYDFAKQIGGDKIEVTLLLPPGMEPHVFEPTPLDIIKISQADIFVYTGDFMEPWVTDILSGINNINLKVVNTSDGVEMIKDTDGHENSDGLDPHIWLDLNNASIMVEDILKALVVVDPVNKIFYQNNAKFYTNKLSILDSHYHNELSKCSKDEFIHGGHFVFGYLANRYGLKYLSAQGFSPDSEPTPQQLISLSKQIKKLGLNYIYFEELVDPKVAKTIADETGAQLLLLHGAHNLSEQELSNGITYEQIMENNLTNLKIGLQCQ